ncbi:MAG: hypothetical protein D4S01_01460 [Dehalococcoidia bacterium]|nr:MAG: hypothetical protein D4S01_01460 [Dehalococcoidia bacterium]
MKIGLLIYFSNSCSNSNQGAFLFLPSQLGKFQLIHLNTKVCGFGFFFLIYNKMATYEEKDLVRTLREEYVAYQRIVQKWFPRLKKSK